VLYKGGLAEAGVCCGVLYKGGLAEAGVLWWAVEGWSDRRGGVGVL
jgi:hypothetical protein